MDCIKEYHKFLAQGGFRLDREASSVLARSVNPIILDFFLEVKADSVNNILEIGRSNGYSFGFFRFAFPKAKVVSVDIIRTDTANKVSKLFDDNFLFIDGTSDKIKDLKIKYDLVFIDGEHTYEWCKRDWDNVQPFLSKNAVVFFDDLDWGDHGVMRFLNTIGNRKEIRYEGRIPMCGIVYCD